MTGDGLQSLYPFLYRGKTDVQGVMQQIRQSTVEKIQEITRLRDRIESDAAGPLGSCASALARAFARNAKLLSFGNGGSATDAQAVAALFLHPPCGRPLPALALSNDTAVLTALSNDVGFELAFSRQITAFGVAGDIAVGLSTSGNSENILRAFDEAFRRRMITVGLAGDTGGKMAECESIDYLFVVPSSSIHRIQEAQTTLTHVLWEMTQHALKDVSIDPLPWQ